MAASSTIEDVEFATPGDIVSFKRGCHLIAISRDKTYLVKDSGLIPLLNTSEIIFLEGHSRDILVTRNEAKSTISIHPLKENELGETIEFPCKGLSSAHLALDRLLVLVMDTKAFGYDLDHIAPVKCPLVGFRVPYESFSAVYMNYFIIWTREARYMIDLADKCLSNIVNNTVSKVSYEEPLSADQEISFCTHNTLVTQTRTETIVYDAAGQIIFRKTHTPGVRAMRLANIHGSGCGFVLGGLLCYLRDHIIHTVPFPSIVSHLCVLVDSNPYIFDPEGNILYPIDHKLKTNPPDCKIAISPVDPLLTAVKLRRRQTFRIGHYMREPTSTALARWPKLGCSGIAELVPPFVYQCGANAYVWRLDETISSCSLRLHTLSHCGPGESLIAYSMTDLTQGEPLTKAPIWKYSYGCVALQIGKYVYLLDGVKGNLLCAPLEVPTPTSEIKDIHSYGLGLWMLFSQEQTLGAISKIFHIPLAAGGTPQDLSQVILENTFLSHGCTNTGVLVLHSPSTSKAFCLQPPKRKIKSDYLPEKILLLSQTGSDVCVLTQDLHIGNIAEKGDTAIVNIFMQVPQDLAPVRAMHVCELRTVIVGPKDYAVTEGTSGHFTRYGLPVEMEEPVTIVLAPPEVDPRERTILIRSKRSVIKVGDIWAVYRPVGSQEPVFLSPDHLATGFTMISPGQAFAKKAENVVVSYIL